MIGEMNEYRVEGFYVFAFFGAAKFWNWTWVSLFFIIPVVDCSDFIVFLCFKTFVVFSVYKNIVPILQLPKNQIHFYKRYPESLLNLERIQIKVTTYSERVDFQTVKNNLHFPSCH